jgi:uncharacterized protein (DUF342 family)
MDSAKTVDRLSENTFFTIEYRDEGVFFSVSPSEDGLSKEDENNILNYIRRKEIRNVDSTAIFNAIYSNPGEEVKIADSQNEKILGQDIEIRVVNRGMEARATLLPGDGGEKLTLKKAVELLHRKGIVFGIDESAIERMLNQEINYKEVPIAYGQPPKKGQDARIKYYIDFDHKAKPSILEDGTVDYKHLNLIHNVTKGQVLAELIPATEGIPGKTVIGKTIAARSGKNLSLPMGKNTVISENKLSLVAGIDGKAEMIDGKIHVFAVYEVPGNVDNSTGNIDFVGNVIVNGNVLTGFEIKAGGYVEVRGVVEGASIFAKGDVVLKQGMQGMGRGNIESHGNVVARFIENGTVSAKGDILTEVILHSNVNCGGKIEVTGRKGLIAGGSISAGSDISAINIGSPMATITELEVGISPVLREEYSALVREMDEINRELKMADQCLALLNKMESIGKLPTDKAELKIKAIRTKLTYGQKVPVIKARIMELEDLLKGVYTGKINIKGTVYPGVKIVIGTSVLYVKEQEQHVTFTRDHGDLVRTSYLG